MRAGQRTGGSSQRSMLLARQGARRGASLSSSLRRAFVHGGCGVSAAASSSNAAAAAAAGATAVAPPTAVPSGAGTPPPFAKRETIKDLQAAGPAAVGRAITLGGWVRTVRNQKGVTFLDLTDGSGPGGLQCVLTPATGGRTGWDGVQAGATPTGAAVSVSGTLVPSKGGRQAFELAAESVDLIGPCDAAAYPLQKKRHTREFLRGVAHLRPRTATLGAAMRVRSSLAQATHAFFAQAGFQYIHTPLITASDCEGGGEAFQVTTLLSPVDAALAGGGAASPAELAAAEAAVSAAGSAVRAAKEAGSGVAPALAALAEAKAALAVVAGRRAAAAGPARRPDGRGVDYASDFFGKAAFLTVSGQLQGEAAACALGDIYTFGPTFRAENSNTPRHLAEFWMIEPEMAFADLGRAMSTAEAFIKAALAAVLAACPADLAALDAAAAASAPPGSPDAAPGVLLARLERLAGPARFHTLSYTDAVSELEAAAARKPGSFEFPIAWGGDLAAEHERWLVDAAFGGDPVFITDWPADIKAFYMKANDDGRTVAAMDLLAPKVGELAGGSAREDDLSKLLSRAAKAGLDLGPGSDLAWYADLRRFGGVPHAGFGVGFERLVQLATGLDNIRDCIPFPRYPGHAEF